jgi:cyanophycin synthetase
VPRIQAAALKAAGVAQQAISVIPDEQDAINAALTMGQPGDLLLIFADALVRSWKQITKFRPAGASAPSTPAPAFATDVGFGAAPAKAGEPAPPAFSLEGLIRDERGVRYAPEAED